jgi:hypothetical protein
MIQLLYTEQKKKAFISDKFSEGLASVLFTADWVMSQLPIPPKRIPRTFNGFVNYLMDLRKKRRLSRGIEVIVGKTQTGNKYMSIRLRKDIVYIETKTPKSKMGYFMFRISNTEK